MGEKVLEDLLNKKKVPKLTLKQKIDLSLLKKACLIHLHDPGMFIRKVGTLYRENVLPDCIISEYVAETLNYLTEKHPSKAKRIYKEFAEYLDEYESARR